MPGNRRQAIWCTCATPGGAAAGLARASLPDGLTEALAEIGVEGAQRVCLGAFGPAGPALGVPRHRVDMRPCHPGLDEFLQIERRDDGAGIGRVGDIVEVGDLAVDHLAIAWP